MQKHIEDEIIAGDAIAIHTNQLDVIYTAQDAGIKVYVPYGEWVGRRFDWFDPAAKVANRLTIAKLKENAPQR